MNWKLPLTLLFAVALGGCASTGPKTGPSLVDATGKEVRAAIVESPAQVVMVNLWSTWCDPCIEEMPEVVQLSKDYRNRGVALVLISADIDAQRKEALAFLAEQGVRETTYLKQGKDQVFIEEMEPEWTGLLPTTLVYDRERKLRHRWEGKITYAQVAKALDALLAEQ